MDFPFFVSQDELKENSIYCNKIPWEVKSSGRQAGSCSFRIGVACQVPRSDTGLCSRWGFACPASPRAPQPAPTVEPDDSTSTSAPCRVGSDPCLSEAAGQTPSLSRHLRPGMLCDVVWRAQLSCHRGMGTP